jgi:hypothetical protein
MEGSGGIPMRPSDENAAPRRSIPEKLLVKKWEYPYPRVLLGLRLAIGVILVAVGILLLPHTHLGLLPLAFAALAFVGGPYIYNKVTQSRPTAS